MKKLEDIQKYEQFIYDHFEIEEMEQKLKIKYFFEIPELTSIEHILEIPLKKNNKKDKETLEELIFHIGLVELISYYKCCCPKKIIVKCGYLTKEQINWFKKLYFYGLGEFFYCNQLEVQEKDFVTIITNGESRKINPTYQGKGNLIAIGGGKDSCVTLNLLKNEPNTSCFIINPKEVMLKCAKKANFQDDQIIKIKRTISQNLLELNKQGFLNGHTPFSAMLAFVSFLTAYVNDYENIILSNESSANESNVKGTKVNHQYSKSYEFEKDFNNYVKEYLKLPINYFSLLRPLSEYQIGMLFSKLPEYHNVFKSCNVGSKTTPWKWCNNCSKCLFVYSLLSPFLYKDKLIEIFKEDLFEKKELLKTFQELLGYGQNKPFDCVGTYEEINYAITKTIKQQQSNKLPFLLEYYKKNYPPANLEKKLELQFNKEHNLNEYFEKIVKKEIFK